MAFKAYRARQVASFLEETIQEIDILIIDRVPRPFLISMPVSLVINIIEVEGTLSIQKYKRMAMPEHKETARQENWMTSSVALPVSGW